MARLGLETGGCSEEMEGRGVLVGGEVYETKVEQYLPLKGGKVSSSLQTTNSLKKTSHLLHSLPTIVKLFQPYKEDYHGLAGPKMTEITV